jgi:NTE family protein
MGTRRALVLGAGGAAAEAWEIGMVAGLADQGVDLAAADLFVGTSAGSIVGAQLAAGIPIEELLRRQVTAPAPEATPIPAVDFVKLKADMLRAKEGGGSTVEIVRRMGAFALTVQGGPERDRRGELSVRLGLPSSTWPERALLVVAVDVEAGERRAFDRRSGAELVDAVAASCAVPGLRPPVAIGGRRYMDGGVHSTDNADLAVGFERVVVLALTPRVPPLAVVPLEEALETLRWSGARAGAIRPDAATEAAFASVGGNLLDPSVRVSAARAGRDQGRAAASAIAELWS